MTVLLSAMLTACATSPANSPAVEPDPIIIYNSRIEKVCPPELLLAIPGRPMTPAGAIMRANDLALEWLAALAAHVTLIETRLSDAAGECPQ